MSTDITMQAAEADVADSLLGDNIIAVLPHLGNPGASPEQLGSDAEQGESQFADAGAMLQEEIEDADPEGVGDAARLKYGDAVVARRLEERGEQVSKRMDFSPDELATLSREERLRRTIEAEEQADAKQAEGRPGEQVQPEITAEQFQPIVEQTYQIVKDLELIDAPKLTADLAPYFVAPIAQHSEEIGLMIGGLTLGSAQLLSQLYKDGTLDAAKPMEFDKLSPLPSAACNYLSERWCAFRGQSVPAKDPITLGNALRNGIANWIHSEGKTDPPMAVMWVQAMEKASTGRDKQVTEEEAMAFITALTPHLKGAVQKIEAAMAAQARPHKGIPRMTSAKKYDGIRTPGLRKQVRQLGNGIDAATLAVYQQEHGRL